MPIQIRRSTVKTSCQWWEITTDTHFIRALISYDTTVALYIAQAGTDPVRIRINGPSRTTSKHMGIAGVVDWKIVSNAQMVEAMEGIGFDLPRAWL